MKQNTINSLILLSLLFILGACSDDPVPKPTAYFRIAVPEKKYQKVDSLSCFSFDLPDYAFIKNSPDMPAGERCWYNIYFPKFQAEVYLTYKPISKEIPLMVMLEDLHKTAYGHSSRADNISTRSFEDPANNKFGFIYDVEGNVASQVQFCITDSTKNFVRGSLYFACPPNKDSLDPIVNFIHQDIDRLINSFRWK